MFACEKEYPLTEFYVKNTSNKTIIFDASVLKGSSMPVENIQRFTVFANDSVLARRVGFKEDGKNPQKWFHKFIIYPVDGIEMNDPELPENWIKHNNNGTPTYVFTLNKN